jgi:hypothetical protein
VQAVAHTDAATPGELGTYPQVETLIVMPGCRHRPLTHTEKAELEFNVGTEMWKTTIPIGEYSEELRAAILALQHDDTLRIHGNEYRIEGGVRPHDDFVRPFKATIISEKHIG